MRYIIFLVLLLLNVIVVAKSHLDFDWTPSIKNRSRRDISCREDLEYAHDNLRCCLNCPAGTYMKSPCFRDSEKGECEQCEFDSFTEHGNGLKKCLSCIKCRSDQDTIEKCTSTQNTRCVCKQGSFCLPDQACEVCKKCSKCKEDEEIVERCTVGSNTVCRKRESLGSSLSVTKLVVLPLIAMLVVCTASFCYWKNTKRSKSAVTSRSPKDVVKICMGDRDDLREERQNAQNAKIDDSSPFQPFLELNHSECELSRRLLPLNGEESLKKSFDFFEEMDVHYHNRFFRFIGLSNNAIKVSESLFPDDRVYELLKIWMEKEGMKADFNTLIEALIYLDQRLSAENIIAKAISNGLFKYEDE
ncbi:hematopoietic death receptor isoform X2 [Triplophysa dalaica]|uniref:hematopoietic death receptor isoform X2 n=1 Tax=Triplophysa dalaica TaxID=1582913 RepID=UPI0024DFA579|nr:hematopoietic death receptor isoform X2 [Triplophysa dalaica]